VLFVKGKTVILIIMVLFAFLDYKTHYKTELRNAPSVSESYMGYTYTTNWDRNNHKTYPMTTEDMYMGGKLTKQVNQ
jgi:hypothetical protein